MGPGMLRPMASASKMSSATRAITAVSRSPIAKQSVCAATSPNPIGAVGIGRRTQQPAARYIAIVGAFAVHGAYACCASAGSAWNGPFAHLYGTGGMRRVHLRGHTNIRKRLLLHGRLQSRTAHATVDRRRHAARAPEAPPCGSDWPSDVYSELARVCGASLVARTALVTSIARS